MSAVFVSPLFEVFAPISGSIAFVEYDLCRAAQSVGVEPCVIARRSEYKPLDWPHTILVDYPQFKDKSFRWWLARAQRKFFGGEHLGDYTYCQRIACAITAQKLDRYPIIVHYQPDTALFLRKKFPHAFIAFWSHSTKDSPPWVRGQLKSAVDLAIGVSDFQCRWLREYFGFEEQHVATVYNGIDTTFFSPAPDDRSTPGALTINYAGRIHPNKGLDVLLRAALKVSETTRNFRIQVVGSDRLTNRQRAQEYRCELDTLIGELDQRGVKVHEYGQIEREQMPEMFRQAQINVVPTRVNEAFGLSTIEGMACGLATIASNTGGTPEVVGDAALLFERDDAAGLAKHLQDLIEDDSLRQQYARRGIERARKFPQEQTWIRLAEILSARHYSTARASVWFLLLLVSSVALSSL